MGTDETKSPAEVVVSVAPTDDVGARTADLFDWQAAMAAADGLSLYFQAIGDTATVELNAGGRVICEHHEDWVVVRGDEAELVSAKHREPGQGGWTTANQLMGKGGVGHLFARWHMLHKRPTCRLVTTAGLSGKSARDLVDVAKILRGARRPADVDATLVDSVIASIHAALRASDDCPQSWISGDGGETPVSQQRDEVRAFLRGFTFDQRDVNRLLVAHAAPTMYAKPILGASGLSGLTEGAAWQAVHDLFRQRMRNSGDSASGALPRVLALGATATEHYLMADLGPRTVTLEEMTFALEAAAAHPLGYAPLHGPVHGSRLALKMARGGCSQTSIERAEDLRQDYNDYWRLRRESVPGSAAERRRVERLLHRLADRTVAMTRDESQAWGAACWAELDETTERLTETELPGEFSSDLALGGVGELAARCKVWFSDRFDVASELDRAAQGEPQ